MRKTMNAGKRPTRRPILMLLATICIGLIKSEQWVRRAEGQGVDVESVYDAMGKRVPLGRVGEAEEYADLIAFLVSERGAYITGTAINLDGGLCPVV